MASDRELIIASGAIGSHPSLRLFLDSMAGDLTVFISSTAELFKGRQREDGRTIQLAGRTRAEGYREVARCLQEWNVSRILCLPDSEEDLRMAVAAADISGGPLAVYLVDRLPEGSHPALSGWLAETIQKARICFALTESIRAYYQKRFPKRIWLAPPVLPARTILRESGKVGEPLAGIFLGPAGNGEVFKRIRHMFAPAQLRLTWIDDSDAVTASGIQAQVPDLQIARIPSLSAPLIAETFQAANFVLVPGVTLNDGPMGSRGNPEVFWQTLEAVTASGLPVILVERSETAASRSLQENGLGVIWYLKDDLGQKLAEVASNAFRERTQEKARQLASQLSGTELVTFVWESLALGCGVDDRYEKMFGGVKDRLAPYVEADPPSDLYWEFRPDYANLRRLRQIGYKPDFICDVGASTGFWSHIASQVYPLARYYLVEPLLQQYLESEGTVYGLHPEFIKIPVAAGKKAGRAKMRVSHDLYGSSLAEAGLFPDARRFQSVDVPVSTLDEIVSRHEVSGRGILKIDVQFTELAVLEGAAAFICQVDYLFIETHLKTFVPGTTTFAQLVEYLQELNFECVDFGSDWRDPSTGQLLQKDVVFGRVGDPPPSGPAAGQAGLSTPAALPGPTALIKRWWSLGRKVGRRVVHR